MRVTVPITNGQARYFAANLNAHPCLVGAIVYPGNQHRSTRLAVAGDRSAIEEVGMLAECQAFVSETMEEAEEWMVLSSRLLHPSALA